MKDHNARYKKDGDRVKFVTRLEDAQNILSLHIADWGQRSTTFYRLTSMIARAKTVCGRRRNERSDMPV